MDNQVTNEEVINERMKRFDKYLEHSGMDKKQYQYDGVKWCLQNELYPIDLYNLKTAKNKKNKLDTITTAKLCVKG